MADVRTWDSIYIGSCFLGFVGKRKNIGSGGEHQARRCNSNTPRVVVLSLFIWNLWFWLWSWEELERNECWWLWGWERGRGGREV